MLYNAAHASTEADFEPLSSDGDVSQTNDRDSQSGGVLALDNSKFIGINDVIDFRSHAGYVQGDIGHIFYCDSFLSPSSLYKQIYIFVCNI